MSYFSVLKSKLTPAAMMIVVLMLATAYSSADVITNWNLITVSATKTGGLNSNLASRVDAIEAIAVYDAVNAIQPIGPAYHYRTHAPRPSSAEAAAAQAAHDVLVYFFPGQQAGLDANLTSTLSGIPDGLAKLNGRTIGSAAAADILALRSSDGSNPDVPYPATGLTGVGQWRPTPPAFAPGINSQWGFVTPFLIREGSEFRPPAPPAVGSFRYNQALAEVKTLGSATSVVRTADQTHIAQFYKQDAELLVNEAARLLATSRGTSLKQNALIFGLVDIAIADARIAIWDAKYTYKFWRPVTALNANPDGAVTNNYLAWQPLIATPPHPEYPSGHSGTVSAGAEILKEFFGDFNTLTLHTTTAGEPPRTVTRISQIAEENGLSRIYGGIHYSFANHEGQRLGRKVAAEVLRKALHEKNHEGRGIDDDDDDSGHDRRRENDYRFDRDRDHGRD